MVQIMHNQNRKYSISVEMGIKQMQNKGHMNVSESLYNKHKASHYVCVK